MIKVTSSHGVPLDEPLFLPVPDSPAWREVEAMGMDLQLLWNNLRKSPEQRIQEHAAALNFAVALQEAARKRNAKSREAD